MPQRNRQPATRNPRPRVDRCIQSPPPPKPRTCAGTRSPVGIRRRGMLPPVGRHPAAGRVVGSGADRVGGSMVANVPPPKAAATSSGGTGWLGRYHPPNPTNHGPLMRPDRNCAACRRPICAVRDNARRDPGADVGIDRFRRIAAPAFYVHFRNRCPNFGQGVGHRRGKARQWAESGRTGAGRRRPALALRRLQREPQSL